MGDEHGRLDDVQLLAASRADPEAFGVLYDRHIDAVLGFCVRRTGCAETAADLAAEVFAAAYVKRGDFRDVGAPVESWLFGIARRQIGTFSRRKRVSTRYRRRVGFSALEVSPEDIDRVLDLVDFESLRGVLRSEVDQLPERQAHALRLRILDDLPYAEVATRLGCSEGAARVRVSRALSSLATALEKS